MSSESKDPAYLAGYKDGYQIAKSEVRTCDLEKPDSHEYRYLMFCSNCGMKTVVANYCSWCGAKVISYE